MQVQGLPGFRDFYPDEAALRNHIFAIWRDVARRYGFQEYEGPPLEPLELYVKKSGEEIVNQLYAVVDRGGREVALRPEMTPTLARMIAARARALKKPIRWYSIPQLLRYERPQRGRLREHYQLNMDIIGEPGPLADAELIAATLDIMRACGLGPADVKARVSDRRVVRALLDAQNLDERQSAAAFQQIDKIEREPRGVLVGRLVESAGLTVAAADRVLSIGEVKGLGGVSEALSGAPNGAEVFEDLSECVAALGAMGLSDFVEVDLGIVRGLAYYTGIVYELFEPSKSLRAVCGGGRYDRLVGDLGTTELPATGFGMGDVVLGELIKERGLLPPVSGQVDVFLVAVTGEEVPLVLQMAHRLRDRGVRTEYALNQQSVAKQLKLAASRAARKAVIVGPDERARGEVTVRDLAAGEEQKVSFDSLEAVFQETEMLSG